MIVQGETIALLPDEAAEIFTLTAREGYDMLTADQVLCARVDSIREHGFGDYIPHVQWADAKPWDETGPTERMAYRAQSELLKPVERAIYTRLDGHPLTEGDELRVDLIPHPITMYCGDEILTIVRNIAGLLGRQACEIEAEVRQMPPPDLPEAVTWIFRNRNPGQMAVSETWHASKLERALQLRILSRTLLADLPD